MTPWQWPRKYACTCRPQKLGFSHVIDPDAIKEIANEEIDTLHNTTG